MGARAGDQDSGEDMTIWAELARAGTAAGDEIILRRRDDRYEIRFNGMELMSNANHQSETVLAERTLRLLGRPARRVLIGGLGLGYTLRTALDCLPPQARVTVAEIVPEIIAWNRGPIGHLAGHPLRDPRVEVRAEDVMETLAAPGGYDVILLDTDNGPDFLSRAENGSLYAPCGMDRVRRALRPGGIAAFWSATASAPFEARLSALPWVWRREDVALIPGRADALHHIYLASPDAFAQAPRAFALAAEGVG